MVDAGHGIPAAFLRTLFEPFDRQMAPRPRLRNSRRCAYLRNGYGDPGLGRPAKPQQLRDLTGALANQNDIVFEAQLRGQNAKAHGSREVS